MNFERASLLRGIFVPVGIELVVLEEGFEKLDCVGSVGFMFGFWGARFEGRESRLDPLIYRGDDIDCIGAAWDAELVCNLFGVLQNVPDILAVGVLVCSS